MDNASKALIIAGAILIAVMLISLGVLIYNRAQETAIGSLETVEKLDERTFNAQFTPYIGTKVKGTSVKSLIDLCKANSVELSSDGITNVGGISSSKTYKVVEAYSSGKINSITITENS